MDRIKRIKKLKEVIATRVVVLDGAMGTTIQALNLSPEDFGGEEYEGCNEYLNITNPNAIKAIHDTFLKAGSDIIETNSFGSTPLVLSEYGQQDKAWEISRASAEIARGSADEYTTDVWPRFVAGSMGPTTKAISVTGGVSWDELAEHYRIQASGLIEGGVDLLLIETDSPYLAPVPHRGRTNEPAFVADTAKFLADLRGVDLDTLAHQTTDNFFRLFPLATRISGKDR